MLLTLLLALVPQVSAAAQEPVAEASAWRLSAGPMVGHVGTDHARIWVQGESQGWVTVDFRERGTEEWLRSLHGNGDELRYLLMREQDFTAVCEVPGLRPGRDYEYRVRAKAGLLVPRGEQSFRTPPERGEPEEFVVAFGSCAGAWGPDAGQPVWRAIDTLHPEVFLWLGDNLYFERAGREWFHPEKMAARWRRQRGLPQLQPLLARTAHYAIWDDHDYGPDNSDKLYGLRDESLELFTRYWANPGYGSSGVRGVWHRFARGRVEFFLLDCRYHRDPDWMEPGPHKSILGNDQWRWLEAGLRASAADFKVVVSSNQVLARHMPFESWDLYPADRARLLALLRRERIGGVLFLSGDRHIGELLRWEPPEAPYPLWELTSSPLAAGIGTFLPDELVEGRVPGSGVAQENFGVLRFEFPEQGGPRVRMALHGVDGRRLTAETVVQRADLEP